MNQKKGRNSTLFFKVLSLFLCSSMLFFLSCGQGEKDRIEEEEIQLVLEKEDLLGKNAILFPIGEQFVRDAAGKNYETGYEILTHSEFFDQKLISLDLNKKRDRIDLSFEIDLTNFGEFPTVYNSSMKKNELADKLEVSINLKKMNGMVQDYTVSRSKNISSLRKMNMTLSLTLEELKAIRIGKYMVEMELEGELVTFFGLSSGVRPFQTAIRFPFVVPPVYHTEVFFGGMKLNALETEYVLGNMNDFDNPKPEAGVRMRYNGVSFFRSFTKNSYTHEKKKMVNLYHLAPDEDEITIALIDVDYGFNGDDLIQDTTLPLKDLLSEKYIDLKMKCADYLKVRAEFKGIKND